MWIGGRGLSSTHCCAVRSFSRCHALNVIVCDDCIMNDINVSDIFFIFPSFF